MRNVQRCGFEIPTPIQAQSIPPAIQGKDLIGQAQTGTGKTAAFILPLLQRLLSGGPRRRIRALILAPTRELVTQTVQAFASLGEGLPFQALPIYGGVSMRPQILGLRRGAEVIVACPGRLLDHLRRNTLSLSTVEYLVLDEADRMFDMGFLPDVRTILSHMPPARQTLLFSATLPDAVRRLAHDILQHPVTIQIASARPAETVLHAIYPVRQTDKARALLAILGQIERKSVLVFTRTRNRATRLAQQLLQAGHPSASLQGGLSQRQRDQAMTGFRSGHVHILVATDLAARGLDVSDISHVINFDMPDSVDDYTHRIGRTGRAARQGDAFTLVTREDGGMIRSIEHVLGAPIERRHLPGLAEEILPSAGGHRPGGARPSAQPTSRPFWNRARAGHRPDRDPRRKSPRNANRKMPVPAHPHSREQSNPSLAHRKVGAP